tara:strand:+ start:2258 stop:2536 length:279 start_codon:yes stop_codon:yes gene_type:complete
MRFIRLTLPNYGTENDSYLFINPEKISSLKRVKKIKGVSEEKTIIYGHEILGVEVMETPEDIMDKIFGKPIMEKINIRTAAPSAIVFDVSNE